MKETQLPFIARYEKKQQEGLSDETLRDLWRKTNMLWRNFRTKKRRSYQNNEEQGKLIDEMVKTW